MSNLEWKAEMRITLFDLVHALVLLSMVGFIGTVCYAIIALVQLVTS